MSISIHPSPPARRAASRAEWVARRRRRMLATGFARVLADARRRPRGLTARVAVERSQVLDAQADIEQLIAWLRDLERPIGAGQLRLAGALLRDGTGPVFSPAVPGTLRHRVRVICDAVE